MIDPTLLQMHIRSLRQLPEGALRRVAAITTERRLRAGAAVFRAGEHPPAVHFVLAGRVRVLQSGGDRASARPRVVHWEESGGTLGEVPTFAGSPFPVTAVAHTAVHLGRIDGAALRRLTSSDPAVAAYFLQRLARRAHGLLEQLEQLRGATVTARLARHVLERSRLANGESFALGMPQSALAEELGTVREVLVRSLGALKRSGAIAQTQRGWYRVTDLTTLRALAG